jgi:hypothetical protein
MEIWWAGCVVFMIAIAVLGYVVETKENKK